MEKMVKTLVAFLMISTVCCCEELWAEICGFVVKDVGKGSIQLFGELHCKLVARVVLVQHVLVKNLHHSLGQKHLYTQ